MNDLIGNRTCDIPARNIAPLPATLPRASHNEAVHKITYCIKPTLPAFLDFVQIPISYKENDISGTQSASFFRWGLPIQFALRKSSSDYDQRFPKDPAQ